VGGRYAPNVFRAGIQGGIETLHAAAVPKEKAAYLAYLLQHIRPELEEPDELEGVTRGRFEEFTEQLATELKLGSEVLNKVKPAKPSCPCQD
jgi:hypothetical protein